ncbi:MAG TPA: hypothetical protein VMD53_18510 [Rhizomicrobium sp.]|nr:hypothetical protein [Rhizomicrobium sp.]
MKRVAYAVGAALFLVLTAVAASAAERTVVVVMFDGFAAAIFYAWGAGIAKGKEIPRLDMIDVHPTVMAFLGLKPGHPVDGHVVEAALAK